MQSTITIQVAGATITLESVPGGGHAAELGDGADVLVVVGRHDSHVFVAVAEVDWAPAAHQARVVARGLGLTAQDAANALPAEVVELVRRAA